MWGWLWDDVLRVRGVLSWGLSMLLLAGVLTLMVFATPETVQRGPLDQRPIPMDVLPGEHREVQDRGPTPDTDPWASVR